MKVLFDHQMFMIQNWGGISRYFAELAREYSRSPEVEPRIYGGLPNRGSLLHSERDSIGARVDCCFVPFVPRTTNLRKAVAGFGVPFELATFRPDVFHPTYFSPNLLGRPRKTALVSTIYDMINERFQDQPGREGLMRAKRALVERSDRVLCISRKTAEDLQEIFGTPADRIDVVHLATRIHEVGGAGWSPSRPFVLYVGQRRGYKNFQTLKLAWEREPRLHSAFDLVCFGGEAWQEGELPSKGNSVVMGGSDALLADVYRQASAFVYPSLYEGFGLPLLEAMALGCPVVTTTEGSIPEVAAEGAVYFEGRSPDSLADALERLLSNDDARRDLVTKGRSRAEDFSWSRCAAETLESYRRSVRERS